MNNKTYNCRIIVIGNDASCKVVGKGTIKLKKFDGTIREVRNVRHAPNLKRNLISLGMLNKIVCLVKLELGSLKVLKVSMLLMKEYMNSSLYVL